MRQFHRGVRNRHCSRGGAPHGLVEIDDRARHQASVVRDEEIDGASRLLGVNEPAKGELAAAFSIQSGSPLSAAWTCLSLSEAIQPTLSWLTRMRLRITEKAVFAVSVASAPLEAQ